MLGLNGLTAGDIKTEESETRRRRRTPSKYAESIKALTTTNPRKIQKERKSEEREEQYFIDPLFSAEKGNIVPCLLPGKNKKIRLSVIIKDNPKPKVRKVVTSQIPEKEKPKDMIKNKSLLDTLLEACQQVEEDENKKQEPLMKGYEQVSGENILSRKQSFVRKEKQEEEKYLRFYQKYRDLTTKLEKSETEIILL